MRFGPVYQPRSLLGPDHLQLYQTVSHYHLYTLESDKQKTENRKLDPLLNTRREFD
jgi:hypothetical protein